eukprot:5386923-Pleurochrysis_carterae.AAC.1
MSDLPVRKPCNLSCSERRDECREVQSKTKTLPSRPTLPTYQNQLTYFYKTSKDLRPRELIQGLH